MKNAIDALSRAFERLSGREQGMVLAMIIALSVFVVGLGQHLIGKDLARREARISAKLERLAELATVRNDYQRRLAEQQRLAAEIRRNNSVRLLSYLEGISKQANTEIKNAAERGGAPTGSEILHEEAAEVRVENVSVDRLYDFLKRIEEGNRLVKVRKLEIETRFDNPKMLNAKVTVGTFKAKES